VGAEVNIPEDKRQALLRLAEFECDRIAASDDVTLMMLLVALAILAKRDAARVTRLTLAADSVLGSEPS
jgi:hypothetical protein